MPIGQLHGDFKQAVSYESGVPQGRPARNTNLRGRQRRSPRTEPGHSNIHKSGKGTKTKRE